MAVGGADNMKPGAAAFSNCKRLFRRLGRHRDNLDGLKQKDISKTWEQQADGTIRIPEPLRPYLGGLEHIG